MQAETSLDAAVLAGADVLAVKLGARAEVGSISFSIMLVIVVAKLQNRLLVQGVVVCALAVIV